MNLIDYQQAVGKLSVNVRAGRASPHKLCMLLAVFDLARAGVLTSNQIMFGPALLERYHLFFHAVRSPTDHPNPYFPFFHLGGKLRGGAPSFWHLHALPGREVALAQLKTARSVSDITANIAWAQLDTALFDLLQQPASVDALAQSLANQWFDRGLHELHWVATRAKEVSNYEYAIRQANSPTACEAPPPTYVRSQAFRRVVTEIYDYRCAATGVRIVLPSGEALVEAAHIHPFSEAGDDDPCNGLALTPDLHWAMDRHLIAPGPDLCWHVSPLLDDRISDHHRLTSLAGRRLLLPKQRRFTPKQHALEWRLQHLRGS
ncbi:MAG: HNH endonuclease [Burkholderiaceae bacterium]|nr:HNH endonuclease [Burkholderiaceae bacterium]